MKNLNLDELDENTLIEPEEAARLLHISKASLYNLLAQHKIPAGKVNKKWLLPRQAVVQYLKDRIKKNEE